MEKSTFYKPEGKTWYTSLFFEEKPQTLGNNFSKATAVLSQIEKQAIIPKHLIVVNEAHCDETATSLETSTSSTTSLETSTSSTMLSSEKTTSNRKPSLETSIPSKKLKISTFSKLTSLDLSKSSSLLSPKKSLPSKQTNLDMVNLGNLVSQNKLFFIKFYITPDHQDFIDKVVLIKDDSPSRNVWKMGKIVDTVKSKDNLVRTVLVKTPTSVIRRPIQRIALLESIF